MVANTNLTNAGKGRQKGVPNRTTGALKEIITAFVENNASDAQELFDKVKSKSPARALALLVKFMEFVLPRQLHSEVNASVTSISFNANEPIRDAASAAAAYAAIVGNPHADMSNITFALPEPAPRVPEPVAVIELIAQPKVEAIEIDPFEAQDAAAAEKNRVLWAKLGGK